MNNKRNIRTTLNKILMHISNPDIIDFIKIMFNTALRAHVCLHLEWNDIDFKKGLILMTPMHMTATTVTVPIDVKTLQILKRRRKAQMASQNVFHKSLTIGKISKTFKKAAVAAGIKNFYLHDLRHISVSIGFVSKRMSMSSLSATFRYLFHTRKDLRAMVNLSELNQTLRVVYASAEYILRQQKKSRPYGTIYPEKGIWHPISTERCSCCKITRKNLSRYTLFLHCKTVHHLSNLFKCPEDKVREMIKKKNWPCLIGIDPRLDSFLAQHFRIS